MTETQLHVLKLLIFTCAFPATVFAVAYGLFAKWWRSHTGRALFTTALALALVLDVTLLTRFYPDLFTLNGWFWIQAVLLFYTASALWYLFFVLMYTLYWRWHKTKTDHRGYDEHNTNK